MASSSTLTPAEAPTPRKPTLFGRYACAAASCAVFSVWYQYTFQSKYPDNEHKIHPYQTTLFLTTFYLVSLPLLKSFTQKYLTPYYDVRAYLKETMILYNVAQVALNGWMVYRFIDALVYRGHPFIGDMHTTATGVPFITWVHYCDKYLEYFDTYFMVLRGRMDQVSFLHVYHHYSITWAWYWAISLFPGGDSYFGAMLNSFIHVLMYAYYALALLKIPCPWKRYLTQAQLLQFTSVVVYNMFGLRMWLQSGEWRWQHITCTIIQVWEMASLFLLFSFFYRRSYGKKAKAKAGPSKDESSKEVLERASSKDTIETVASDDSSSFEDERAAAMGEGLKSVTSADDQCQKAMKAAVKGAANVVNASTKDMKKMKSRVVKVC